MSAGDGIFDQGRDYGEESEAMEQLTFSQILIVVGVGFLGLIATVFVVRVGISFNWVDYLKYRREIQVGKLQNLCPHSEIVKVSGRVGVQSLFHSPAGTAVYICRQCQAVLHHEEHIRDNDRRWANDLEGLLEQQKKFQKAARKFYNM